MVEFLLEQQAGIRIEQLGDADGRRMGAMDRAEGVLNEEVLALGERARERWVVRLLAGIEARVLEHGERPVEELAQPGFNRAYGELRVPSPSAGRGASRP